MYSVSMRTRFGIHAWSLNTVTWMSGVRSKTYTLPEWYCRHEEGFLKSVVSTKLSQRLNPGIPYIMYLPLMLSLTQGHSEQCNHIIPSHTVLSCYFSKKPYLLQLAAACLVMNLKIV